MSVREMFEAKKRASARDAIRPTRKPVSYSYKDGTVTMTAESFQNAIHSREEAEKFEAALEEWYKRQDIDPYHYIPGQTYTNCPICDPDDKFPCQQCGMHNPCRCTESYE